MRRSFLLIDMRQPTVETRPIELIAGASPFCETFFTDTRADKDALLGELNKGRDVGKRLLQHERASQTGASAGAAAAPLQDIAKRYLEVDSFGRLADADLRRRLTDHLMSDKAHALTIDNNKRSSHRAYKLAINTSLSSQTGTSASRSGSSQDSPYDEIPCRSSTSGESSRRDSERAAKRVGEGALGGVAEFAADAGDVGVAALQRRTRERETPSPHVAERRLPDLAGKRRGEGGARHAGRAGEPRHRPWESDILMDGAKRAPEPWVRERTQPSRPQSLDALCIGPDRFDQQHIGEPGAHDLTAHRAPLRLAAQQREDHAHGA
jgi:hypothetical protein